MTNEELDRWIAEKIMGMCTDEGPNMEATGFTPSTNIAQAVQAAEANGKIWRLQRRSGHGVRPKDFKADIGYNGSLSSGIADTPALAICKALAAQGGRA